MNDQLDLANFNYQNFFDEVLDHGAIDSAISIPTAAQLRLGHIYCVQY